MEMDRELWLEDFSSAFRRWVDLYRAVHNIEHRSEFAEIIGITSGWTHIITGKAMPNPEVCALIFYVTDIPEADPRNLPPRTLGTRSGTRQIPIKWTQKEYEHWVAKTQDELDALREELDVDRINRMIAAYDSGSHVAQNINYSVDVNLAELAERVSRVILQQSAGAVESLEERLEALVHELTILIKDNDAHARDLFASRYGEKAREILNMLGVLLLDKEDRERTIEMNRRFS